MAWRPATPGTIVVFAATVLLVLVSVSTPLLKTFYFLDATISSGSIKGTVKLGTFGYCVGNKCTSAKLGYQLDVASLLGINGKLGDLSDSVLKWATYCLVLHPVAAVLGAISVVFGLLAHMHNFAGTMLSTCFASFAGTVTLLAFIFDMVVFIIAKQRIDSSSVGGQATLGNAIWMTLAALILFLISGFFFGCGTCSTRRNRREQKQSDMYRPMPDENYGSKLRADAVKAEYARKEDAANLPNFPEHVPLTATHHVDYDDTYASYPPQQQQQHQQYASHGDLSSVGASGAAPPSLISGVGEGYGRRNPSAPGQPVSFSPESGAASLPPVSPVGAPTGAGARLAAEARANRGFATAADERRLAGASDGYDQDPQQQQQQQQYHAYGGSQGHAMSPSSYSGAYPPYPAASPPPPQPAATPYVDGYQSATPGPSYADPSSSSAQPPVLPYRPSTASPPIHAQQSKQGMYVQNQAPSSYGHGAGSVADPYARAGETGSLAPTYYTHEQGGTQYQRATGSGMGAGQQQDPYGAPAGYGRY
ncbi:hypothetical protein JCM8208_001177 [Rhodotorula glutinis]